MKLQLTTDTIATLTSSSDRTDTFAWDAQLAGFGIRIQGTRRTFIVQYRINGRTQRRTLGPTERLTLAEARKGARKLLASVALGGDPQGEKATKRAQAERTFSKIVDAYLVDKEDTHRPTSHRLAKLYLRGPYFRPLHGMGIGEISRADVATRLTAIRRAHSSHTAAAARRAISAMFVWCMEEGLVDANPVAKTRKPAEAKSRDRVLSDAELVAVWNACNSDGDYGSIVRLLILLGSRRQEIGGMRWCELDLEAGILDAAGHAQQERCGQHDYVAAAGAGDRPCGIGSALSDPDASA